MSDQPPLTLTQESKVNQVQNIPTAQVIAGDNDRKAFDRSELQELAASIAEHGLAQPITVRPLWTCQACDHTYTEEPTTCDDCESESFSFTYQIVAGERRFRAINQVLGQATIPAFVREMDDETASAIMLTENVARKDLDPIDEAMAYQTRIDRFGWTVQDIADKAGVSTVRVQFRLKLLRLRPEIQKLVRDDQIQLGYAQILSDGGLDVNRQLIALSRHRDNPSPTPQWFRREVGKLLEEQAQDAFFDLDAFLVVQESKPETTFVEPAHPMTTIPPTDGETPREIVSNQIGFWEEAAQAGRAGQVIQKARVRIRRAGPDFRADCFRVKDRR